MAVVLYRGYTYMVVYWVVQVETVVSRESWITSQRQWKGWLSRTHDHKGAEARAAAGEASLSASPRL